MSRTENVIKADYYEVLRGNAHGNRPGAESGVPQAGDAVSSGSQSGKCRGGRALQGVQRSVPGAERSAEARSVRPVRPCGRERGGAASGRRSPGHWATSSATCSARCSTWAATRRASRVQKGRDIRHDLTIEFEEAVFGKETKVTIRRMEPCKDCRGTGTATGRGPTTCPHCAGRGQVRYQQGFFSIARTCTACAGTGTVISDPCLQLPRRGTRRAAARDHREYSGGSGRRHTHSLPGRGRRGAASADRRAICTSC